MSTRGWEQLDCNFFAATCRRVLGGYLGEKGFGEYKETVRGGLVFVRFDIFLEISYDTNLFPDYSIRVVVGIGEGAYNASGGFSGIPMWYILPEGHPYRTKVHWIFRTENDLSRVLAEIRDEFLESTLSPLLLNRDALERLSKNFQAEFC